MDKLLYILAGVLIILMCCGCSGSGSGDDPIVPSTISVQIEGAATLEEGDSQEFKAIIPNGISASYIWSVEPQSAGTFTNASNQTTLFLPGWVSQDTNVVVKVLVKASGYSSKTVTYPTTINNTLGLTVGNILDMGPLHGWKFVVYENESAALRITTYGDTGITYGWSFIPGDAGYFTDSTTATPSFHANGIIGDELAVDVKCIVDSDNYSTQVREQTIYIRERPPEEPEPSAIVIDCVMIAAEDYAGNLPYSEVSGHYLTKTNLENLEAWTKHFWSKYDIDLNFGDDYYKLSGGQFYELATQQESRLMHTTIGKTLFPGKLCIYFVNHLDSYYNQGFETAYCTVPGTLVEHNTENVYVVVSPTQWNQQMVVAHELGHAIGAYIDMYLFDAWNVSSCDQLKSYYDFPWNWEYLYCEDGEARQGNLMYYGYDYLTIDDYWLGDGQASYVHWFQETYSNNF